MAVVPRALALALAAGALGAPACADPMPLYGAMLARPLFSPTRRPPPPPLPEAPLALAPPLAPSPGVALSGVIATPAGGVALLRRPGDPASVRLARGGALDGWTLAEIRPRSVVLVRDGHSITVEMSPGGP